MPDFFKSPRFKIIIAVIALLFGMMLYSASSVGVSAFSRNLLSIVTTPFQKGSSAIASSAGGFFDRIVNSKRNAEENQKLKQQIAQLNKQMVDYDEVKAENEQLRSITKVQKQHSDYKTAMAFVISRDPDDRYSSFLIDEGSLVGIKINDPVITEQGLVGIVTQVNQTSARVRTILSPDIYVGCYENPSGELGIVKGDTYLAQKGIAKFNIMSADSKVTSGGMIVTGGTSGLYPKGIPVGTVISVGKNSNGISKYAEVRPFVSIADVKSVIIITDFSGKGSQLLSYIK